MDYIGELANDCTQRIKGLELFGLQQVYAQDYLGWTLGVRLPAYLILIGFAVCSLSAIVMRDPTWIAIPLFDFAVSVLAVISQGAIYRYLAAATILNLMAVGLSLIYLMASAKQKQGESLSEEKQ